MKWYRFVPVLLVGVFILGGAMVQPALAQVMVQDRPGSFLVYPLFDVISAQLPDPLAGVRNETKIRITNLSSQFDVFAHVVMICGSGSVDFPSTVCAENNFPVFLSHHSTVVLDLSTQGRACDSGFVVVYAQANVGSFLNPGEAGIPGAPISFNALIGDYQVFIRQNRATIPYPLNPAPLNPASPLFVPSIDNTVEAGNAISIQSPQVAFTKLGTQPSANRMVLSFGTPVAPEIVADYAFLPKFLYADFAAVASDLSGQDADTDGGLELDTRLILLTLDLTTNVSGSLSADLLVWDQDEDVHSTPGITASCWDRRPLATISTAFYNNETFVLPGMLPTDYGSLRVSTRGAALLGAIEEVSLLPDPNALVITSRGNTIRSLFQSGFQKATFNSVFDDVFEICPGNPGCP